MKKAITYEELIELAKARYNRGGDGFIECWSQKDFEEYVKEYGPVTQDDAIEAMDFYYDMYNEP